MYLKRNEFSKITALLLLALFFSWSPAHAQSLNVNQWLEYANKGMFEQAITELSKVIKTYPDSADAHYNRGTLYAQLKKYDEAIDDFNKAVKINPKYADAYYNRAVCYYVKKQYENAWADVHTAEKLGYDIKSAFLDMLKKASGREK